MPLPLRACLVALLSVAPLGGCAALLQGDPTVEVEVPNSAVTYGFEPRLKADNGALLAPHLGGVGGFVFKADRRLGYQAILSPLGFQVPLRRRLRPALAWDAWPAAAGLGLSAFFWATGGANARSLMPQAFTALPAGGGLALSALLLGADAALGAWWETPPQSLPALVP